MKQEMKKEINIRYTEIFKKLYLDWKIESEFKYKEITDRGLNKSGVGIKMMYDIIEKLTHKTIEELDNMFQDINREFKTDIPLKYLREYINDGEEAIHKHIKNMEQELTKKVEKRFTKDSSIEIKINNLKQNAKIKMERIYDKNKNIHNFKKIEWLVIINTIATIGSFIIGIIGLGY